MPAIRDWTFNYDNVATATTIGAALPNHEVGDLLLAILTADTGAQVWSSTGWTQLFSFTNTANIGVLWKIAGASEADPVFTHSVGETVNVHLLAIRDVDTAAPFNGTGGAGTGYRTGTLASAAGVMPALTTTLNNSLILYAIVESTSVVPSIFQGPATYENAADGSAHSDGFSWGFKTAAGLIPNTVKYSKSGTAVGAQVTIGISPPASGATYIPAYCAEDASLYIDPIHGITAYNGNTALAATVTTDFGVLVNTRTLANGTVVAGLDVGINSYHSMGRLTGVATVNTVAGLRLALAVANKPNVVGKNVIVHVKPSTPKVLQNTDAVTKKGTFTKGFYFGMASSADNFKLWHVHGANTEWGTAQHLPIIINNGNTSGLQQTTGALDAASVSSFAFATSGFLAAPIWDIGSLWVLDTTIVAGGTALEPVGVQGINKICAKGKERMSVLQQGASQILVMQPVQFGDGGSNPIFLDLDATAIEFPKQYNQAAKQVFYCSVDNVAGLTYNAGASDTIKHTNAVVSSQSPFHWRIHAASSPSASYNFSGLSLIGAGDVVLRNVTTFSGMSFTSCLSVAQNSAPLDKCKVYGTKITALTLADVAKITNTAFTSAGTGHAIEVAGAVANITFTGNTFTGYAATNGVTGNEAIFVNIATGTVTINIAGGGSTPTIRTAGATVSVVSVATVNVNGLVSGSRVKAVKISDGAVLFNGSEVAGAISFVTDQLVPIEITARKGTGTPYYQQWVTQLTPAAGATSTATALQILD